MSSDNTNPVSAEQSGDRRGFLGALTTVAAALFGLLAAPLALARQAEKESPERQTSPYRWGMVIDLDRCAGCGACVVACKEENNVSAGGTDPKWIGRRIEWMTLRKQTIGSYPNPRIEIQPMPCNHCGSAACVKVCPVGATYINEEGIVAVVADQCIGCRYCMMACPYSRRYFNWFAPEWPGNMQYMLNPDVATRPVGVVEKCSFCHHRIRKARLTARIEKRVFADGDVETACQEACPAKAIAFGNLNDPKSRVRHMASSPRAWRLLDELGTDPKVYYLSRDRTG